MDRKSTPLTMRQKTALRVRRVLALLGFLLLVSSMILTLLLNRAPEYEQLRLTPPATLLAPPGTPP